MDLGGGTAVIAGIAKGAGMIAPDMATMLGFILTDASLDGGTLGPLLSNAVGDTFNAITVDGDMSTNDTVLLLASGKGPEVLTAGDLESFSQGVRSVCGDLSEMIVADGEGSRKVVTVRVTGARDAGDARKAAKAVAESLLVKTALAAEDPNWGRIAAAAGYSGALMDPASMGLSIGEVQVLRGGELVAGYREEEAVQVMARDRYDIHLDLGKGGAAAEVRTCDLTEEYVRINCEYRS
ncbi:MAG: bifunctional ornithine acetyltransferase/N-acetylglutamate synthase [bacterium]|nr:MAG: bifunctional ornithine acetyltransferase/N-acetylglutamate synthase [bacterium]